MHGGIGGGHFSRQRDHQANGQLSDGYSVCAGRVHHYDAAARGGFRVDVVHANAGAANDAKFGRVLKKCVVHLHRAADHERVGIGQRGSQSFGQLVVRFDFPSLLARKHGQRGRRNFFRQYDFHGCSLIRRSGPACVLIKANALLFAEQIEHAHHRRVRLAFAALVFGERVGMHSQPLRHFVLIEIELLARDEQLFSEG